MRIGGLVAAGGIILPSQALADVRYRVTLCGDLPGGYVSSSGTAINNTGHVAGNSSLGVGSGGQRRTHGFLWTPQAGMLDIGAIENSTGYSYALAINNNSHIAGRAGNPRPELTGQAIFWTSGEGLLGLDGVVDTAEAFGINDFDEVVGVAYADNDNQGFYWNPTDGMIRIGDLPGGEIRSVPLAINNHGVAVGWSVDANGPRPFVWDRVNGMRRFRGVPGIIPLDLGDINDLGQVCGQAFGPDGYQGFFWDPEEGFTLIPAIPGQLWASATGMNNRGEVLLQFQEGTVVRSARWDRVNGVRRWLPSDLDPCFPPLTFWGYIGAADINDHGQLAATIQGLAGWSGAAALLTPYIPGDLDADGFVEIVDLVRLLVNFGTPTAATYADGDLDCDAAVTLADLSIILTNFGEALP
jgi:probable HAF family extracellular repeat protein